MVNSSKFFDYYIKPIVGQKLILMALNYQFIFDKIILLISFTNLKSEEDSLLLEAISLLDIISMQKPYVKQSGFCYVGSQKMYRATLLVTLRGHALYKFLLYSIMILFPLYVRREGFLRMNYLQSDFFSMSIDDYNLFYNLKHGLSKAKLHLIFFGSDSFFIFFKESLLLLGFPIR